MPKFRKKPVVVEATKWEKNGDHPEDNCYMIYPDPRSATQFDPFLSEGKVVRYFRSTDRLGQETCGYCHKTMHDHGWIDTLEGGHIVCPGDWVITGISQEHYPCKPDGFAKTYELAEEKLSCPYCGLGIQTPYNDDNYHDLFDYEDQGTRVYRCPCGREFMLDRNTTFSVREVER